MKKRELSAGRKVHSRAVVVELARLWLGTPYHHQASCRGAGCDCLGLVRGVFREIYGFEAEKVPAYSQDWSEVGSKETLLDAGSKHLVPVDIARPGDVLVFRFREKTIAKHAAIKVGEGRMIHAVENAPVCEVHMGPWWTRRIVGCFSFPGCID